MNTTECTLFDNVSTAVASVEAAPSLSSRAKTVVATLGVIFNLIGAVGNVSILCVIARDKTLRKPYNALLGSMAFNDIVRLGVLNMIQASGIYLEEFPLTWPSQRMMCKIHSILWTPFVLTAILHIMAIAFHRYLLVYHTKLSDRISNKRCMGILICALYIASFALLGGKFSPNNSFRFISSHGRCFGNLPGHMNLAIILVSTFLVIVISLASYIRVYYKVSSSKEQLQLVSIGGAIYGNQRRRLQIMTQHKKILLCMVVIVILLTVSVGSGALSNLMAKKNIDRPSTISIALVISWIAGMMNCLIYGVFDSRFRNSFKRLFLCNNKVGPVG